MIIWHLMRHWAIVRHAVVNCGNPYTWPAHMAVIRAVYGY